MEETGFEEREASLLSTLSTSWNHLRGIVSTIPTMFYHAWLSRQYACARRSFQPVKVSSI